MHDLMKNQMESHNKIKYELRVFKRKYLLNELFKGCIFAIGLGGFYWLALATIEYFFYLPNSARTVFFVSLILGELYLLSKYIAIPGYKLITLEKSLSDTEAARIIGKHFVEVEDKLLNLLQLESISDSELVRASILQKSKGLSGIPFSRSVSFKKTVRFFAYLIPTTVFVLALLISGHRAALSQGSGRIIAFNRHFERPNPFSVQVLNEELAVFEGENFLFQFSVGGNSVPDNVSLVFDDMELPVSKSASHYSFAFRQVKSDRSFFVRTNGFLSGPFSLNVKPKTSLRNFQLKVVAPAYTRMPAQVFAALTDIAIQKGSTLFWTVQASPKDEVSLMIDTLHLRESVRLEAQMRLAHDVTYALTLQNGFHEQTTPSYRIKILEDKYPIIRAKFEMDSILMDRIAIDVDAFDDFGIIGVFVEAHGNGKLLKRVPIAEIDKPTIEIGFSRVLVLNDVFPESTQKLRVAVFDNDAVSGSKAGYSQYFALHALNKQEQRRESGKQLDDIQDKTQRLRKELQNRKHFTNESNNTNARSKWNEAQERLESIKKMKDALKSVDNLSKQLERQNERDRQQKNLSDELLERQKRIEELAKKMNDPEVKKLLEELEKLQKEKRSDKQQEAMDKQLSLELSNMEDQLERLEKLLQQLKLERKLEENIEKAKEISEKLEELSRQDGEDIQKQEEINEEISDLNESVDELKDQMKEQGLEDEMDDLDKTGDELKEDADDATDNLQKGKQEKANQKQQSGAQKAQKMSQQMQQMLSMMSGGQMMENIEDLTRIIDNLITASYNQEDIIMALGDAKPGSDAYVKLLRRQGQLSDAFNLVRDSLKSLALRTPMIEPNITKELLTIQEKQADAIEALKESSKNEGENYQRFIMTSTNNLALMLSNTLQQMQMQMAQEMSGEQQCQNPGSGKPGKGKKGSQMMMELRKAMEEMLEKGSMPSGEGEGSQGKSRNSKEIMEMMRLQEALNDEMKGGSEGSGNQELLDKLEEIEKDIALGNINNELLERMRDIEVKLLENEKAELTQDEKEERESRSSDLQMRAVEQKEDERRRSSSTEFIYRAPLRLNPHYSKSLQSGE